MELTSRWKQAAGAAVGTAALAFTVGCNTIPAAGVAAQQAAANPGAPVVVSCEPHQRTLVRQAVVNGTAVSQVECVAAAPGAAAQPMAYAPAAPAYRQPVYAEPVSQPVYTSDSAAQIVPISSTGPRIVPARQVVYEDERPVRKTRSVKKSAIIIGSSAGAGAGVGAAIGGKKGALIGAAVGGGGAALWDQITRRK
jgi:hypothetical protein